MGEGGGQGAGDIFVMRSDGSDVGLFTDGAFEEATPAFAPRVTVTPGCTEGIREKSGKERSGWSVAHPGRVRDLRGTCPGTSPLQCQAR